MPWKPIATLAALAMLAAASLAQSSPHPGELPSPQPAGRPAIGLALEGGGALGIAHIGVLQWFEEHHIPVDRLAGTSMGALVGGLYATGRTPAELRTLALGDSLPSVFSLQTPYAESSFRRRQDQHEVPQSITVGLRQNPHVRNAIFSSRGVDEFLSTEYFAYNSLGLDFDRLPIPFRCVATDLTTLKAVTFSSGPLPDAVRASISIPGVFPPVQDRNGHFLVDGGILDNLPTDVLRRDLKADTAIAVRLEDAPLAAADTLTIVGVLNRAFSAGIVHNVDQAESLADLVIRVPVGSFSSLDYSKAQELIDAGYKAAEANRSALLLHALNDADWAAYLAARQSRKGPAPGNLRQVQIDGAGPAAVRQVQAAFKPLEGQPISPARTLSALNPIQSNDVYGAHYSTFAPPPASPSQAAPAAGANPLDAGVPDTGIKVRLGKGLTGPPYLLIGPDLTAATSNVTRGIMTLRFVDQNLGGFDSEFRAQARLGYLTDLWAEYYRLLTPSGYFIEPRAGVLRAPVYIWANQKRVAERSEENLFAEVQAGRTFTPHLQVSAAWRAQDTRWRLTTGSGGGPFISGTAQTGLLHIDLDKAVTASVSPNGFRLTLAAGAFYHAEQSANAPLVRFSFARTRPFGQGNIFGIMADVNSYLRANVAQPYRFTLGGPQRLSASSMDEFRGTDTALARAGYLRRIAALPTGLGQGIYAVLAYEAGEIWSPEANAILRQDGTAGLLANTPLGVITVGASVGDAGHRKLFVTLGRIF